MSSLTWDAGLVAPSARRRTAPLRPSAVRPAARGAAPVAATAPAARRAGAVPDGLRLTARGRLVVTAVALALAGGVLVSAQGAAADGPQDAVAVEARTVAPGETLWSVAASLAEPGQDVRDVVDALADLNGLTGSGLVAGQQLLVPATE